jgi:hypothetical protein
MSDIPPMGEMGGLSEDPDMTGVSTDVADEGLVDMYNSPDDDEDVLEVVAMHASMTAIGSVSTEEFDATQCAIATASVDGDASIGASVVGVISAGSVGVHQGGAMVMVVDGDASIDQGGAQVVVAGTVGVDQGGVGILVTDEANLARSWVGVMAARNATLSDDSRVIIDTRSALIIGGLLFGGLGLVAVGVFMAGRRIASRIPRVPWAGHGHRGPGHVGGAHVAAMMRSRMGEMPNLPHIPDMPKMPDLSKVDWSSVVEMISKLRRAG